MKKQKKLFYVGIIIGVVILALIVIMLFGRGAAKGNEAEIVTSSTLEKIVNVSELSTFEAIYNGIATVANQEEPAEIDYHVYYEATVKAGIDFEQVEIVVDNENKKISVTLPAVEITEVNVDIASLEYIFENSNADTETVSQEAYKACIADVTEESGTESAIYELAEQNARNIVEALVKPFVSQLDAEYLLEVY